MEKFLPDKLKLQHDGSLSDYTRPDRIIVEVDFVGTTVEVVVSVPDNNELVQRILNAIYKELP